MDVILESVSKVFQHRPAFFNWFGAERGGETRALHQVTMALSSGEVLAILGPNGSGKTTLLKLIATSLLPDAGKVIVGGFDTQLQPARVRNHVAYAVLNQRSFYPRLTAAENLDFFATFENVPRGARPEIVRSVLQMTEMTEYADLLVMKMSSGMQQRLGLARALLKQPSVLLLDEPSSSLDPGTALRMWELVRRMASGGRTTIVATHNLQEAVAIADTVAVLRRGELLIVRRSAGDNVDDLRRWYFQHVEDSTVLAASGVTL